MVHHGQIRAKEVIEEVARDFSKKFGRFQGGLIESYKMEGAEVALIAMGSIIGSIKDAVDEMRAEGIKVGAVKVRTYRPFPVEALRDALKGVKAICVVDRNISMGMEGALFTDLKAGLYAKSNAEILGFIAGLGGRDLTIKDFKTMANKGFAKLKGENVSEMEWYNLDTGILPEGI